MNEIVKQNNIPQIAKEQVIKYLDLVGVGKNILPQEREMFIEVCLMSNLNPFKREAYIVAYGEGEKRTLAILTGYEKYLKNAELSGMLDGWKSWTEGEATYTMKTIQKQGKNGHYNKEIKVWGGNLVAKIEIWRKDWSRPFCHEVPFLEYVQDNPFWDKMPKGMIEKVVRAQAFRIAFPIENGGMPYTTDEMPTPAETIDIKHVEVETVQKPVTEPAQKSNKISDKKLAEALEKMPQNPVKMLEFLKTRELTSEQKEQINTSIFKFLQDLNINEVENIQLQDAVLKCYPLPQEMVDFLIDTTTNNPVNS